MFSYYFYLYNESRGRTVNYTMESSTKVGTIVLNNSSIKRFRRMQLPRTLSNHKIDYRLVY